MTKTNKSMTINEIISQLQSLNDKEKELPLYACDTNGNNYPIHSISLYNECEEHTKNNPLGANF